MPVMTSNKDILCVYGLPEPDLYAEFKCWMEEGETHFLIILEDDSKALAAYRPGHERIRVCDATSEEGLKKIIWELVFLEFEYYKHPGNSLKNPKKMEMVFAKAAQLQEGIHLVASEFQHRGLDLYHNYVENAPLLAKAARGSELFGVFQNTPAVICGAGVSLEQARPFLETMKDQGLIFAGGTALAALSTYKITPDFAGMIDPHPPSERYDLDQALDVPTFFQSRVHPKLLKQRRGPLLWMPGNENDLFEEESFDGGWNVATFLTAIAYHLGCNPIILVGVDLAQSKQQTYAGDFKRSEGGELIEVKEGLYTRRDWLFAAEWLSEFAHKHSEIEWVNLSKGLELKGFKTELGSYAAKKPNIAMEELKSEVPLMDVEKLKASFARVGVHCAQMLELLEKIFPSPPEKNGEVALLQLDIEKEEAYVQFLLPIWSIWKHVFAREIPKEIPLAYGIGLNQWLFMKGICDDAGKV